MTIACEAEYTSCSNEHYLYWTPREALDETISLPNLGNFIARVSDNVLGLPRQH